MGFLYLFDVDNTAVATGAESIRRREELTTLLTGEGFAPDRVAGAIKRFDSPQTRLISNFTKQVQTLCDDLGLAPDGELSGRVFDTLNITMPPLIPEVRDTMRAINVDGDWVVLFTNRPPNELAAMVAEYDLPVDYTASTRDWAPKPNPAGIYAAIKEYRRTHGGELPEGLLHVGDEMMADGRSVAFARHPQVLEKLAEDGPRAMAALAGHPQYRARLGHRTDISDAGRGHLALLEELVPDYRSYAKALPMDHVSVAYARGNRAFVHIGKSGLGHPPVSDVRELASTLRWRRLHLLHRDLERRVRQAGVAL